MDGYRIVRDEIGDRVIQLSELFGAARPSIGRAMSELNHEGIIRTEGRTVTLLDPDRLAMLLK